MRARSTSWTRPIVAACLLVLAACEGAPTSTLPISSNQALAEPTLTPPPTGRITVGPGDTVYSISRRYGMTTRDIIDANGLVPPFELFVGQELRLPAPRRYVVRTGDTIFSISRRFDVDMNTVVRMNGLGPPYQIRVGQTLDLPSGTREVAWAAPDPSRGVGGSTGGRAAGGRPVGLPPLPLRRPSLGNAEGTVTRAPAPPAASPPASTSTSISVAPRAPAGEGDDTVVAGQDGVPLPSRRPVMAGGAQPPAQSSAQSQPRVSPAVLRSIQPPPRQSGRFLMPVQGRVIIGFGPREGGLHNDGINISAPRGASIRAAENGVVAYAGNGLAGFGNLLLIKHADGWTTAYAHADRLLVSRGDTVRRGQAIATVGSTGNVERPQLHFEIRKGARAVNPTSLLAP